MVSPAGLPVELEALAERIVQAMRREATQFVAPGNAPEIDWRTAVFVMVRDPASRLPGYEGVWRNASNARCGILNINSDASFYAEYDLFCPHPGDPKWFVEMVTAWGRGDELRCEVGLIPSS